MSESQAKPQVLPKNTLPAWWYNTPRNNKVVIQLARTEVNKHERVSDIPVRIVQQYGAWSIYTGASYRGAAVTKRGAMVKAMQLGGYQSTLVQQQLDGQLPIFSDL